MEIYYRYGMAKEKPLFENLKDFYSGLIIPAHIAIDQKDSLPGWLAANQIDYFIDPITFIFNESSAKLYNTKNNLRRSYKKYSDSLRLDHINYEEDEVLEISYFETDSIFDETKINNFTNLFLNAQATMKELDDETKELINYFKENNIPYPLSDILDKGHSPLFLVSPGFFFKNTKDKWFKMTVKLIEVMNHLSGDIDNYGYLLIDISIFKEKNIESIVNQIPEDLKGVVIWFEGFNDLNAEEEELRFVAKMVKNLSERGLEVINLYGGIFSALLCDIGCTGYSSGLCYDLSRTKKIEPSGGPIPFRYYIPEINRLMGQTEVESFFRLFNTKLCECDLCKSKVVNVPNQDSSSKIHLFFDSFFKYEPGKEGDFATHENMLKEHFIRSVNHQLKRIQKEGSNKILEEKINFYSTIANDFGTSIANKYASHIPKWQTVLNEFK